MIVPFVPAHRRALRLIDDRLDAERGDAPPLSEKDADWLDRHLESCPDCQMADADRRALVERLAALPDPQPPADLARRVRVAAAREPPGEDLPSGGAGAWRAGALAAVTLLAAALGASLLPRAPGGAEVAVGGAARLGRRPPHFVLRAPLEGAARFRSIAVRVVEAHGGRLQAAPREVRAVLPRERLVDVLSELEGRGGFEVELVTEPGAAEQVVLRFVY
jgi:hypothetical protein